MTWHGPTFRISDGETIDGAWRLVWWRDEWQDEYYPEDLFVYADGRISRGPYGATDLAGLARLLTSGKVALARPDGRERTVEPSKWLARYPEPLTNESFLVEVADEISRLAGRPRAVDLLWEAIRGYQRDTTEANRSLLRAAYLAVPAHRRVFVLGDMDQQDRPLRILVTDLGEPVDGDGPAATPEMHRGALDYFADGDEGVEREERQRAVWYADEPGGDPQPPVVLSETVYTRGWPAELGNFALRNEYDAPFTYEGETYPTVVHGYWALFAADRADHDRIRSASTAREARELGAAAVGRANWSARRPAVMAALLRAKFGQHPGLAEVLVATGEGAILYAGTPDSAFWHHGGARGGRNWIGRLLELIRSELLAAGPDGGRAD